MELGWFGVPRRLSSSGLAVAPDGALTWAVTILSVCFSLNLLLAVLNLKTGKSVWADGSFAPPVVEQEKAATPAPAGSAETPRPGRRDDRELDSDSATEALSRLIVTGRNSRREAVAIPRSQHQQQRDQRELGAQQPAIGRAEQQLRLLDLVTGRAARVLGIPGHGIAEGNRADLCVHHHERVVDVLREHARPRWVLRAGRVVALEGRTACLMQNPGHVGYGHDLAYAVESAVLVEWACTVYWRARAIGEPVALSDEQLRALLARRTRRTAATLHPRVMTARESKALANRIVH